MNMAKDDFHNRNFDMCLLDVMKSYQNEGTTNMTKKPCVCQKRLTKKGKWKR